MNPSQYKFIVTGGSGFIGSAVVRHLVNDLGCEVLNIDDLTYAGTRESLISVENNNLYKFKKENICNLKVIKEIFEEFQPDKVMHLAAESHVDRSISSPLEFINTNIIGTYNLLEASMSYFNKIKMDNPNKAKSFIFHHISTDEVFGALEQGQELFNENSPYDPSSPYSASKAGSDHLVRAWNRTYKLPVVVTNCSNNYGPFQFPEKLIPLTIQNALKNLPIKIYGDGLQIRDWLYVEDHAQALITTILNSNIGETYNIGGYNEKTNLSVVQAICSRLDELIPSNQKEIVSYHDLISFVDDRPGHDFRYAINATKIKNDLGWVPHETFESGIRKTIDWYLKNQEWCNNLESS